jgi:[ribosomal protein S18]-alanine N-acetyltransferase
MSEAQYVRPAIESDLDAIATIQSASPDAAGWAARDYLKFDTWVALAATGDIAGFVATRTVAPGESEILNIAVGARFRRMGVGRTLILSAIDRAPGIWFLEVRESNAAARNLYKSIGFIDSGVRKAYYQNPDEDGIVMTKYS